MPAFQRHRDSTSRRWRSRAIANGLIVGPLGGCASYPAGAGPGIVREVNRGLGGSARITSWLSPFAEGTAAAHSSESDFGIVTVSAWDTGLLLVWTHRAGANRVFGLDLQYSVKLPPQRSSSGVLIAQCF